MSKVRKTKVYRGQRLENGDCVVTVDGKPLNPRFDLRNHSPAGFNWGYGGSGPAQLALALLADALRNDQLAEAWYQDFKWGVVLALKEGDWELTELEIAQYIAAATAAELLELGKKKGDVQQ